MSTRGFTWLLVILIVAPVLALMGGGYYYLGVYQPKEYTKQVSRFYENLKSDEQNLGSTTSSIKSSNDYKNATLSLNVIDQFLSEQEAKLNKIKPPLFGPGKKLHEDFLTLFKSSHEAIDDNKRRAEFMVKATELEDVMSPKTSQTFDPATAKVKDLQQFYNKWIPEVKQVGNDLFGDGDEAPNLTEVSYDELKTAWEQAEPGFDTLLAAVHSLDPNAPLDPSLLLQSQLESGQTKEAGDRVNSFNKLLKAAIDNNTASDILSLSSSSQSSQQLEQKLQELQKKYFGGR